MSAHSFAEFFRQATSSPDEPQERTPYPYQTAFAESESMPELLNVPTGVGKTAAAVLVWLYRQRVPGRWKSSPINTNAIRLLPADASVG